MKPAAPSNSPAPSATDKVRSLLNAKQWRKARDEAKQGCKADKATFLPLLIEANTGLALEMISKKQISEAEQVISYLATIAPKEIVDLLKKEIVAQKESLAGATPAPPQASASVRLPTLDEVTALASKLSSGEEIASSDWDRIDAWVAELLSRSLPTLKEGSSQVLQDLIAIGSAVEAVGNGDFPAAQDLLRPLSLKSALQHWKSFLRAVVFTHQGEKEKAIKGFSTLTASAFLTRASVPYLSLLRLPAEAAAKASDEQVAYGLLALVGGDPGWAPAVAKAESHWIKGEASRAYHALRNGAKGKFPTIAPNAAGSLTDQVFATGELSDDRRDQLLSAVLADLPKALERHKESLAMLRCVMLNLDFLKETDIPTVFETYLRVWKAEAGLSPETEALARVWLAEKWADEATVPSRIPGQFEVLMRNPKAAQAEFEKAIRLRPDWVKPYLGLCRVLERIETNSSKRQQLLDGMCQRFEEDKNVLVLAAESDLELRNFSKALAILEKALRLDPLDTRLQEDVVFAKAGEIIAKEERAAPDEWADVEPLLVNEAKVQARSRWCMRLIQGAGHQRGSFAAVREEGMALAPHPLVAVYFERMFCICFILPVPKDSAARWKAALPSVSTETIIQLLDVFEYWVLRRKSDGEDKQARGPLEAAMAAVKFKTASAEAVLKLADALVSRVTKGAKDAQFRELCDYLIFLLHKRFLSKEHKPKSDPRLRLAVAVLDDLRCFRETVYEPEFYLKNLAKDATAAGLPVVAERARKLLHKVKELHSKRRGHFDDPIVEVIPAGPDGYADDESGLSNDDIRGFMDIILQIKDTHPRDVAAFRKRVIKEGVIPVEMFDLLVDFAMHSSDEELAEIMMGEDEDDDEPDPPPSKPKGRGKTAHPDQLDLF
ncbi:hypothetical protein [Verrucomicrobium sp. BvORR106]|uniref:hypothetical protein n=1 Tax=Verrucomicrobium sp. BvORR106 TaxID=1403819 RepID=UPI000571E432|nr:hypothetical protein [Verrucomicrobium sp. BvORR106]